MGALRNCFFKTLYYSGFRRVLLKRNRRLSKVPVLVFHKIIPEYDETWPGIHPKLFEEIILMLKKHYVILPVNDLFVKNEKELRNACFITFDDGYKDFLDFAYPILKRHSVPTSLYVLPYDLSNNGHIWTSTIMFFVKHYSYEEILDFLATSGVEIPLRKNMSYFELSQSIIRYFCSREQKERAPFIKSLQDKFIKDNRIIQTELLSFAELAHVNPDLVCIESHSLTHPSFKLEGEEDFIRFEIQHSKALIEDHLKTKVKSFAFPFAKYNPLSLKLVRNYYNMSFTRINDFVDLKKLAADKEYYYDLPRFNVHHDTCEEVFFLINGFHKNINKVFRR